MRKYSIPYNGDTRILDRLFEEVPGAEHHCKEIFFPVPTCLLGSSRAVEQSEEETYQLIKKARQLGVKSDLLLNPGCLHLKLADSGFIPSLIAYFASLAEMVGLDTVTVSDFLVAREIKKAIPGITLECSCGAYVDSLEKARYWVDIGCDVLVIPPDFNKDTDFISGLREYFPGLQLKLILNEACLPHCPMRQGHINMEGHGDDGECYVQACTDLYRERPWLFYSSSYIPPAYLDHYDNYIDIYKVIDRTAPTEKIIEAFGVYCGDKNYNAERQDWNRRIPKEIFEQVIHCDKRCSQCNSCKEFYNDPGTPGNSYMEELLANPDYL